MKSVKDSIGHCIKDYRERSGVNFISDAHRRVDFYNLASRTDIFLSVAAQNSAGISVPSVPIAIRTL